MSLNIEELYQFESKINEILNAAIMSAIEKYQASLTSKEWMTLAEASKYAGVSHNTFVKFREMGLKVAQVDGIKRVSRNEIDTFLKKHSF
ncbi:MULTISPECIES: helix-turn-helix domain-containing protein [Lysinibacillus]|uniref:helix-turn-helix domain-containing protein n=1 Tax=Lysinibacillus TaxID=400634 RepID=UPI001967C729|nr:helix-turn-helix domain-containing protein [Lysinibacillus fusiformis]QSB10854.1 helix-turn-helix domain-containing protein [Lysinibacillus fusiformis]